MMKIYNCLYYEMIWRMLHCEPLGHMPLAEQRMDVSLMIAATLTIEVPHSHCRIPLPAMR